MTRELTEMQTNPSSGLLTILGISMTGVNEYDNLHFAGMVYPENVKIMV